jgi:hypothetical protein
MNAGAWWGGLVLSVAGWGTAFAQEGVWRRAESWPAPRTVIRMSGAALSGPAPAVTLGRPVALGRPRAMPEEAGRPAEPGSFDGIVPSWIPLPDNPLATTKHLEASPPAGPRDTKSVGQVAWEEEVGWEPSTAMPARPPSGPRGRWHLPPTDRPRKFDPHVRRTAGQDWASGPTPPTGLRTWGPPGFDVPFTPEIEPVFAPAPQPRMYARAEYLLWWVEHDKAPVLFSTSQPADAGFLGRPSTRVLFGGGGLDRDPRSGGRFLIGLELCGDHREAIEFGGFFLGSRSARFIGNSADNPVLARPFFAQNLDAEFSEVLGFPDQLTGNGVVDAPSKLWGLEANARCQVCCGGNYGVSFLAGLRYLDLEESINITENVLGLPTNPNPTFQNQRITVRDRFATENHFLGAQVGLESRHVWGRWGLDLSGKLALGGTRQHVQIAGSQRFVDSAGQVREFEGGLLALRSNIGRRDRTRFSVVPEIGVRLGYQLTPRVRATFGYNFLYWSSVARPGAQIDRVLDVTQIPNFPVTGVPPVGQDRPAASFRSEGLWVQGLTFGLECSW